MNADNTTTTATNRQLLLTARDAAKALAISESLLWKHTCPRGDIPCLKIGRCVRYRPADLEAWANAAVSSYDSNQDA